MSKKVADQFGEADTGVNMKEPSLGWLICFLLVVSFVGLFSVVPLRKVSCLPFVHFAICSIHVINELKCYIFCLSDHDHRV